MDDPDEDAPVLVIGCKGCNESNTPWHELCEQEIELEDRLREAQCQFRIAEGLTAVYGDMGKVQDELRQRRTTVDTLGEELVEIRKRMEEDLYGKDEDNKDWPPTLANRGGPPSPPTQSPVTFAEILLDFMEIKRTRDEMCRVVEAFLSTPEINCDDRMWKADGAVDGNLHWPTATATMTKGGAKGEAALLLAGTDVLGYRLPPDGAVGFRTFAGTKERSFCRPPDLGCDGLDGAGTNVLWFCGPPDPGPRNKLQRSEEGFRLQPAGRVHLISLARKMKPRTTVTRIGTDERRFHRPPDPARVGSTEDEQGSFCVGTKERRFWVPPNGGAGLPATAA